MKLIDIMKRYNKCILKENAKLRSIYNTLIRECDGVDTENECDTNECDGKEKNECEGTTMSVAEFLGECDKEDTAEKTDECDACGDDSCKDGEKCGLKEGEEDDGSENENENEDAKKEQIDEVSDGDLMTAEEFFGSKEKTAEKTDECDACGDDSCKDGEKCGLKEGEEETDDSKKKVDEDEELISKKEFYATESDEKKVDEDEEQIDEEAEEDLTEETEEETEEETNEDETETVDESEKKDSEETKLDESLEEHYRAANRKLFNF